MYRLSFLLTVLLTLTIAGCGGGGPTTPAFWTLEGLEGIWDYSMQASGNLSGPIGSVPFSETLDGNFTVGRMSVIDGADNLVWAYDGVKLTLDDSELWDYGSDPLCGDTNAAAVLQLIIPIQPGDTLAAIGGLIQVSLTTQNCGNALGDFNITGNMTKR